MPTAPLRPCPRCHRRGCTEHVRQRQPHQGSAAAQGYGVAWRQARDAWLRDHPYCVEDHAGQLVAATVVDHIKPHNGDQKLFWDTTNWQSLCKPHHDAKTARERAARRHGR